MISGQVASIVWAQWRSILNYSGRARRHGIPIAAIFLFLWYAVWVFGAFGVFSVAADPENLALLDRALPVALLAIGLYWQLVPIMMASSGLSLDLARLRVYPIPHVQLFGIEVLLRGTTSVEMLILMAGLGTGLLANPRLPWWSPAGLVVFSLLNLLLSAGIRDLFTRLMARKGVREVAVFLTVILAAAPQLLLTRTALPQWRAMMETGFGPIWPWSSTARLAVGHADAVAACVLLGWTALAYAFSRRQFEKSLRTGPAESGRSQRPATRRFPSLTDLLLRVPALVLPDPLAAMVEKEIRTLSRAPRFRLLFMMGFSFGLLIWLPLALRGDPQSPITGNYLTIVSAYALMLLGEVCFWNIFGMDRDASQIYFVVPVAFRTVLVAKNLAAAFFILFELSLVTLFCAVLGMPISRGDVAEALGVTLVLAVFLLATGNILSTRYPRAVDPSHSWRSGSIGRVQAFLLLLYPVASVPLLLAYGARYAFETDAAFYMVLALDLLLAAIVYYVSMDTAVSNATQQKEEFLTALSSAEGPIGL